MLEGNIFNRSEHYVSATRYFLTPQMLLWIRVYRVLTTKLKLKFVGLIYYTDTKEHELIFGSTPLCVVVCSEMETI